MQGAAWQSRAPRQTARRSTRSRLPGAWPLELDDHSGRTTSGDRRNIYPIGARPSGVFCPIGFGCVSFESVAEVLEEIGYDGAATIEQDRAPRDAGPALAQLRASVAHLERAFGERLSS